LQDRPKFTQIEIFGLKIKPSGNPGEWFLSGAFCLQHNKNFQQSTCSPPFKKRLLQFKFFGGIMQIFSYSDKN
jgi:hypothetical protein